MLFKSKWITTDDFRRLKPINIFHKETAGGLKIDRTPFENYHANFRKQFKLRKNGSYKIYISADDYYKLYINGKFVGQGPAPAYHDCYNYNVFDITDFLSDGDNVIAVSVYYHGLINRVFNSADNRFGMIADIYNESGMILGTDKSWQYKIAGEYSGEAVGYGTSFLENIDFNLKDIDWKTPVQEWAGAKQAQEKSDDDHIFKNEVPAVSVYKIKPKIVKELPNRGFFIDFEKEITGSIFFSARGKKGERVIIKYGEETEEGSPCKVRYKMRCNCNYMETCILSGKKDEFEFYDYKGFRYVQIEPESNCINKEEIYAIVRHHEFDESKSDIKCSDSLTEEIWRICRDTLRAGVQEGFLDCPTREKGQYLGDFTVSGLAYLYLTGDSEIYRKTLYDFAESARVCKGLLAVAPGGFMQEIADYSLQYPLQLYHYYQYTGDKKTLSELLPVCEDILKYFKAYEREDGLLFGVGEKWNLVDWPVNLRDNYDCETVQGKAPDKCHNVINAFYLGAVLYTEKCRDSLNISYNKKYDKLKEAFIKVFYNKKKKLFVDAEDSAHSALHSNAVAAFFGAAPEEAKESIIKFIMEKGFCCGVYMSYFVLKALGMLGAYKEEYELMTNTSEHSWANMLREGAKTCFEAWGKEQKWNTSLCHPWACSPVIVLAEDFLGIDMSTFRTGNMNYAPNLPPEIELDLKLPVSGEAGCFTSVKN